MKRKWNKCTFETNNWGMYITPLIGVDWQKGYKRIWFGWFKWLFVYDIDVKE
jgi:hypothetical protein